MGDTEGTFVLKKMVSIHLKFIITDNPSDRALWVNVN